MDRLVLENKTESLRRCIARVQTKCPSSLAALDAQDFLPYVQRMLKQRRLAWIG